MAVRLPEFAILGQTVHMFCNFTLPAGHHNFYSLKVSPAQPSPAQPSPSLPPPGDSVNIPVVPGRGRGLQIRARGQAGAPADGFQLGQHQDRPGELQDDRSQGAPAGPPDGQPGPEWGVLVPGDDGHATIPVHPILVLPHRHGLTRETPRHIRPQADNLLAGRQGLHQLHLQPQLPGGPAVLAAQQAEG